MKTTSEVQCRKKDTWVQYKNSWSTKVTILHCLTPLLNSQCWWAWKKVIWGLFSPPTFSQERLALLLISFQITSLLLPGTDSTPFSMEASQWLSFVKAFYRFLHVVSIDVFCKQPCNKQDPAGRKSSWGNKPQKPSIYSLNHTAGASARVMTSLLYI